MSYSAVPGVGSTNNLDSYSDLLDIDSLPLQFPFHGDSQSLFSHSASQMAISDDLWNSEEGREVMDLDYMEDTSTESSSTELKKSRRGRKTKPETMLLNHFYAIPKRKAGDMKPPKKEYLRVKLIRALKRAIRQEEDQILPRTKIHKLVKGNRKTLKKWRVFCEFINENQNLLPISQTSSGPTTEAKTTRKKNEGALHCSHNDEYCRELFAASVVREAYRKLLDVVFENERTEELEERFQIRAVDIGDGWTPSESWQRLKQYLYWGMLQELHLPEDDEWAVRRKSLSTG